MTVVVGQGAAVTTGPPLVGEGISGTIGAGGGVRSAGRFFLNRNRRLPSQIPEDPGLGACAGSGDSARGVRRAGRDAVRFGDVGEAAFPTVLADGNGPTGRASSC